MGYVKKEIPQAMKEVIFLGRGGQGGVIASRLLACAAFIDGKNVQAFPFFGVERRGAPVRAYARIGESPIRKRSPIEKADYVIVLDSTLLEGGNMPSYLKENGSVIINTKDDSLERSRKGLGYIYTFDASSVAVKHRLGTENAPIVNTAILGVIAKITKLVKMESLVRAIKENMSVKKDENVKAAREAYEKTPAKKR